MNEEPFLEIKLNTDSLHFIQELVRLSNAFRQRSLLQIGAIGVRVDNFDFQTRQVDQIDPDINHLSRSDLELLTQPDQTSWTLLFHTVQQGEPWKIHFWFDLQAIGGSHPLLVRLKSHDQDLYPLLINLLERCGVLWDAQLVSPGHQSAEWSFFFRVVDVRPYPWLSALERQYDGTSYDRFAPSAERTRGERAALETLVDQAPARDSYAIGSDTSAEPSTAEVPDDIPEVPTDGADPAPEPPVAPLEHASDAHEPAHDTAPVEPAPLHPIPKRMYGPTEGKVAKVRELLAQKRQGQHRRRPWSWACEKAEIDLKTAQRHLAEEHTEWDTLNTRPQSRTGPSPTPDQPLGEADG